MERIERTLVLNSDQPLHRESIRLNTVEQEEEEDVESVMSKTIN